MFQKLDWQALLKENIYFIGLMISGLFIFAFGASFILISFGLVPLFLVGIFLLKYSALSVYGLLAKSGAHLPELSSNIGIIQGLSFKDSLCLEQVTRLVITNLKLLLLVFVRCFLGVATFAFSVCSLLLLFALMLAPVFYIIDLIFPSDYIQYIFIDLGILSVPVNGILSIILCAVGLAGFALFTHLSHKLYDALQHMRALSLGRWL